MKKPRISRATRYIGWGDFSVQYLPGLGTGCRTLIGSLPWVRWSIEIHPRGYYQRPYGYKIKR